MKMTTEPELDNRIEELERQLRDGIVTVSDVVASWNSGGLEEAIYNLDHWADQARETLR